MYKKYNEEDLKKLHGDIITVYNKFRSLCEKYDIKFFAISGTLLGAVRHKGFIPWDDDMDIGMFYSDYIKFLSIPKEEFDEYGFYAPSVTPGGYYIIIPKFYYKNSRFVTRLAKESGMDDMGIFVEIFPYYNIPADNNILHNIDTKIKIIKALYTVTSCEKTVVFEKGLPGQFKYLAKVFIKHLCKIFGITPKKLSDYFNKTMLKYENKETGYVLTCVDSFEIYKKKWFSKLIDSEFEDTAMPIPVGYKEILSHFYGDDYMTLPPESKRWNQAAKYIKYLDGTEFIDDEDC